MDWQDVFCRAKQKFFANTVCISRILTMQGGKTAAKV